MPGLKKSLVNRDMFFSMSLVFFPFFKFAVFLFGSFPAELIHLFVEFGDFL